MGSKSNKKYREHKVYNANVFGRINSVRNLDYGILSIKKVTKYKNEHSIDFIVLNKFHLKPDGKQAKGSLFFCRIYGNCGCSILNESEV